LTPDSNISHEVRNLTQPPSAVVRVLPSAVKHMRLAATKGRSGPGWKDHDVRIICDCQLHARRERTLVRRSLRLAQTAGRHIRRRSVAILIGVPVAFGVIGYPMDAMNNTLPALARTATRELRQARELPIFTTPHTRATFLKPVVEQQLFTLEVAKEQFFRTNVPYGSIIYSEARKNQLQPELVAAVVEAESDFRPRLVSEKDARGLMQLVPETGRLMGTRNLFNPNENIAAGTKYLRYLFDRFGGDQRMVLAAYNAGEGNVERFGGVPPFPETQNYLQRVSARTQQYRQGIRGTYVASLRLRQASAQ
jgi:hypothetical protein